LTFCQSQAFLMKRMLRREEILVRQGKYCNG
jgi:hypothetical protein